MAKTSEFFDRLIERLDRLDSSSVQGYILRLVREKGLLETVFQTIREGVLIIDRELAIRYINHAALDMLGLPPDVVHAREPHRINRYLREVDWQRLISQDPGEWERVARHEIEVFYPQHRFLQFYLLPYRNELDPENQLGHVVMILHDVTDLRLSTQSTIESERLNAITLLAAGVAHEIGNPLNGLTIHLQLLQRTLRDKTRYKHVREAMELLETATDEVRRLDTIISQFLKAIRPMPLNLVPLSLAEVISDTLRVMKAEIEGRDLHVVCQWLEDVPRIMGDAGQLHQAFYNLARNALQAMSAGGVLTIALEQQAEAVILSFHDTGKGISAAELGQLFSPYYTTKPGGTGLGLVIVERIIREHGATMNVESEPGQGTTFTIRFPIRQQRTRLLEYHPSTAEATGPTIAHEETSSAHH